MSKSHTTYSAEKLFSLLQNNSDPVAFEELYNRYWLRLYMTAYKQTNVIQTSIGKSLILRTEKGLRFIRVYLYFVMGQLYGDVPLDTIALTIAQANEVTRTAKIEVTKRMLGELAEKKSRVLI